MNAVVNSPNVSELAARGWVLEVRGVTAVVFGILAVLTPGVSLLALAVLWGVYALFDGVLTLMLGGRGPRGERSWRWLVFEGITGILAGASAFLWTAMSARLLLVLIAGWALLKGLAQIASSLRVRRELGHEWLCAASGILSVAFGVVLLASPGTGVPVLMWMLGAYAIVFGTMLGALGLRLSRWARSGELATASGAPTGT